MSCRPPVTQKSMITVSQPCNTKSRGSLHAVQRGRQHRATRKSSSRTYGFRTVKYRKPPAGSRCGIVRCLPRGTSPHRDTEHDAGFATWTEAGQYVGKPASGVTTYPYGKPPSRVTTGGSKRPPSRVTLKSPRSGGPRPPTEARLRPSIGCRMPRPTWMRRAFRGHRGHAGAPRGEMTRESTI